MTDRERSSLIADGISFHRAGDRDAAASCYAAVLRDSPDDYDALYLLGIIAYQQESNSRAIELLGRAVASDPLQSAARNALGLALRRNGRDHDAVVQFREAVGCNPSSAAAHHNLGLTLAAMGDFHGAVESYCAAIELAPGHKNALYQLALALVHLDRGQEASESLRRVLGIDPAFGDAYLELAELLRAQGNPREAIAVLKQVIASCGQDAEFLAGAGTAFADMRQWKTSADAFGKALALDQNHLSSLTGLGAVEVDNSQEARALPRFERALARNPDCAEAHFHRARALCGLGQIEDAIDAFTRSAELGLAAGRNNVASIIPGDPRASNRDVLDNRREWAKRFARGSAVQGGFSTRPRGAGGKLRLGYVSRSFHHPNWMKPVWALLNRHDRRQFTVHLFSDSPRSSVDYGFAPQPGDQFHDTASLSAAELAALVSRMEIDLLVDLNSYGAMGRLPLYALKPAPLIIGWFNSYATTGIEQFDCLVGDDQVIPPDEEQFYVERIVRVPGSYLSFEVNYPVPDVAAPPCLRRGHLTFGSMCSLYKLTNEVASSWARILRECPTAHLFLKNAGLASAANREWLAAKFAACGVAPSRLRLEGPSAHFDFLAKYAEIDIALDTFPYNGGTTTTEAIWQGIPVITFRGDRWVSRTSASLLVNGGLGEFVADDHEGYVRRAVEFGNNPATPSRLEHLRRDMRLRLAASPVCDVAAFTRNMERIYRDLWSGRQPD